MKYLRYLLLAAVISVLLLPLLTLAMGWERALGYLVVLAPLSLWTARLIEALRSGRVTRRMPMLDGGPAMSGLFWSFSPEVYERRPGFDNFKGYVLKECACCFLLWLMLLGGPLAQLFARGVA